MPSSKGEAYRSAKVRHCRYEPRRSAMHVCCQGKCLLSICLHIKLDDSAAKSGDLDGLPWLAHSHTQPLAAKTAVDLPPRWLLESEGRHCKWCTSWQGRCAERFEELCEHGLTRASQRWMPQGKWSGEGKWPMFYSLRLGMICGQPDQHWFCFKGNFWRDFLGTEWLLLFVGCLMSQQHTSVSTGWICSDKFMCCHTQIEVADQIFYLTQSQYTDTRLTSPSADPVSPGAWHGSHWSANF